ncbi:hypothetical protein CC86DRAFT_293910 [Ophiobolus disseminans]|uniref:Altered inheritance of mitochondria protein 9, mitochondrial n=1 Tax=Ophiobolus disseminans TaxID=1469910 RepID=A0A6A6ZZ44_9PLEO|nr:hypothetical protein CC86DRAFT_293910 [Ophiobolus disseminans]
MSTTSNPEHEDFCRHTSGCWLWDEETRLLERYRKFDVPQLKKFAIDSVDAEQCVSMTKRPEGWFNKVFRLVIDNDAVVIARIPNPNAGPPFLKTASEVATMEFARSVLGILVPKVLSWSGDSSNPVDSG